MLATLPSAIGLVPERLPAAGRPKLKRPSKLLMFSEWRAIVEFGAGVATLPALLTAPHGDGHPVLVLPGFLASDLSTDFMRRYLRLLGYDTYAWDLGRNFGGVYSMRKATRSLLARIHRKTGKRVTLVGWSLGGVYARDMAFGMPEAVRAVVTLGSPFSNDATATNANELYEMLCGESIATAPIGDLERLADPLPMPSTSIYTRSDGIVNWRTCIGTETATHQNIEVYASHLGLGSNPSALWALADRLALPENAYRPFERSGPFALAYPPEHRAS